MKTFVLDLNDAELRIGHDAKTVARSTGFAMVLPKGVLLGEEAVRQFRLHPRQANNLFWHRLDTDLLPTRAAEVSSHADLVFRHLAALTASVQWAPEDELIIAAPATTTTDQLSLLLGIAEQAGVRVSGLVDSAVAATATGEMPDRFTFVDVSLHRLSATRIDGGVELSRSGAQDVTEVSLSALLDAWLNLIADRFVQETRFDPLAVAETEQQIYDQVYDWLFGGARNGKLSVEVRYRDVGRRVEVSEENLITKAYPRYELAERALDGAPVVLSHRAAALPGFVSALSARGRIVESTTEAALFDGVARHAAAIRSNPEALRLVTRLPSNGERRARPTETTARPTHVLYGATARPIGQGLTLHRSTFADLPNGFSDGGAGLIAAADAVRLSLSPGTTAAVNRTPARDGMVLSPGDQLELGGARFHLIEVMETMDR